MRLYEMNRLKSDFLATMSHELRTPLNAIILYSEMLQEGAIADGRQVDAADLARIQMASKHLLSLINGILDLSKIEAGKMELQLETFDIKRMIGDLISTIDAVVRQNGNTLSVTFGDDLEDMHADLTKVRQILFNLLSNAAKFTTGGAVSFHVARRSVEGRHMVEFQVADTGIGLTAAQQARLFQPFAQGDTSVSRRYGGTGLGLFLVWRFCQLMGGRVSVDSTEGHGARFTVLLPVRVREEPPAAAAPTPSRHAAAPTLQPVGAPD
jgi:signal transduction histidine kinase